MHATRHIAISLLAIMALGAYSAALAPAVTDPSPSARLQASGSGKVVLSGQLVAFGLTSGTSRIVIVDRRGDANLTMNGTTRMRSLKGSAQRKRQVVINNAEGRFYVRGSWVKVVVEAAQLNLSVAGRGTARLRGVGRYTLNESNSRDWSIDPRQWQNLRLRTPQAR